jgi:hypothetical protein
MTDNHRKSRLCTLKEDVSDNRGGSFAINNISYPGKCLASPPSYQQKANKNLHNGAVNSNYFVNDIGVVCFS